MYKILLDILVSSILYASLLSLFFPFFRSYYPKYPVLSGGILYFLFFIVCIFSIFFPIGISLYISYVWIYQVLLIAYIAYVGLKLFIFLPLSWWQLKTQKIYLPKQLKYIDKYKETIAQNIHIRKKIILHINKKEGSPFTWGWVKPIVSFPQLAVEKLSHLQIKSLLLHELVHIKKKDYLVGIVLYIIDTLFIFNPFIKWWIKEIRFLQEVVCDKRVIKRYSIKEYIEALLLFAKNNKNISFLKISVNYDLYNRIALMVGEQKLKFNKKIRYSSLVSCILFFFLIHNHSSISNNTADISKHKIHTSQQRNQPVITIASSTVTEKTKRILSSTKSTISVCIEQSSCIDTPARLVAKSSEVINTCCEDVDVSQKYNNIHEEYNAHQVRNKKYLVPKEMDRDSLIMAMISKATFLLMNSEDVAHQYPYISKVLTQQQIKNIQLNNQSPESLELLNYFMDLTYRRLQLDVENIDWQVLNMQLDNQVVDIILTQKNSQ